MFHIYSIFTNPSWDLRCMEKDFILFIKWTLSHSRMVCFSLSERCEIFTRPNFHTSGFSQRALWHLSPTSEPCSVLVAWLALNTSISFFKQRLPSIQLHLSDSAGAKDKDLDRAFHSVLPITCLNHQLTNTFCPKVPKASTQLHRPVPPTLVPIQKQPVEQSEGRMPRW